MRMDKMLNPLPTHLSALRCELSSSSSPILPSCPLQRSFIVRRASCSVFRLASEKSEAAMSFTFALFRFRPPSHCRNFLLTLLSVVIFSLKSSFAKLVEVNHSPAARAPRCAADTRPCPIVANANCHATIRDAT